MLRCGLSPRDFRPFAAPKCCNHAKNHHNIAMFGLKRRRREERQNALDAGSIFARAFAGGENSFGLTASELVAVLMSPKNANEIRRESRYLSRACPYLGEFLNVSARGVLPGLMPPLNDPDARTAAWWRRYWAGPVAKGGSRPGLISRIAPGAPTRRTARFLLGETKRRRARADFARRMPRPKRWAATLPHPWLSCGASGAAPSWRRTCTTSQTGMTWPTLAAGP